MTVNDHAVDIRHWQIFQIVGVIVYIDLGMPVNPLLRMQNSPSELLIFFRFDSGISIPSSIPLLVTWAATREIFSVGDATNEVALAEGDKAKVEEATTVWISLRHDVLLQLGDFRSELGGCFF